MSDEDIVKDLKEAVRQVNIHLDLARNAGLRVDIVLDITDVVTMSGRRVPIKKLTIDGVWKQV